MDLLRLMVLGIFALPAAYSSRMYPDTEDRNLIGMVGLNIWDNSTLHVAAMRSAYEEPSITVVGPDDVRAAYRTEVDSQGILQVGPTAAVGNASMGMRLLTNLKYIAVGGATDIGFFDDFGGEEFTLIATSSAKVEFPSQFFLAYNRLTIIASGSSSITAAIDEATSVNITVTDNAEVKITCGKAVSGKVVVRGSGRLLASHLAFDEANVEVYDQGQADLNVRGKRLVTKDKTATLMFKDKKRIFPEKAVAKKAPFIITSNTRTANKA